MIEEKVEMRKLSIFDGKNFSNWKFRTEVAMREYNIDNFLKKPVEENEEFEVDAADTPEIGAEKESQKNEDKCCSMIVQRIGDDYLEYVKDKTNPKEIWSGLTGIFERKGVSNTNSKNGRRQYFEKSLTEI